ncbi:U4/U6.U5 tri-snRNP-associated protein 1 [Ambystoma mexicanum]|uniref:U4/U6.U5 tri-snRNP-associated protein 1 n=1 Tax=Ambystoma mexicanum TaxID=8296 RepID=UPI0037E99E50
MGSSKKHRKDGEERHREHKKHKHRDKDKEKDKDKARGSRKRSRERSGRERKTSRGGAATADGGPPASAISAPGGSSNRRIKREKLDAGYEQQQAPGPKSASGDASLSIEETNKLRAKLGLKPLELNTVKHEVGSKEDPVAAEVINPIALRQREELREKLAAAKEKRLLNQKLGKVKSLGDDDLWLDDATSWVEKSRKIQDERDQAERRAKLLQEMDEEFGVSNLVEKEFGQKKDDYSSRDLQGLTVEHTLDSFREGQTVILTLKDKGVMEEDATDVLVNVNIVDQEKAKKNTELKKKRPDYKPYEEEESVDDMAMLKHKTVLSKYDEEIEGEKKKSFRLESGGTADCSWEKELQHIRENLRNQAQSLDLPAMKIASEYYTPEEMDVTFKKTKRRVKRIRKKDKTVKVEDLLFGFEMSAEDYGSRIRGRGLWRSEPEEELEEGEYYEIGAEYPDLFPQSDDRRVEKMDISDDEEGESPESPVCIEEDEAELELQKQLEKGRKLKQLQQLKDSGEKVIDMVKKLEASKGREEDDDPEKKGAIVFNATSEFCRTLGEIPTYGLAGNREDQEDLVDFDNEKEGSPNPNLDSDGEENLGWSTVNLDEEQHQHDFSTSSTTILDEEPIVNRGLGAALLLCQNKGLLETQMQKIARVKAPNKSLPSALYCIEDKMAIDDKYSRREEYRGFTQEFKEKEGYRPDVKIEYVDETGRKLCPKEAFRQLSHRFHGKGSGKMKTERRMKKLEEEALLKKMSSSDTPLGTVALLQEKQKAQKTPYIVLSGSGKSMNVNTITK